MTTIAELTAHCCGVCGKGFLEEADLQGHTAEFDHDGEPCKRIEIRPNTEGRPPVSYTWAPYDKHECGTVDVAGIGQDKEGQIRVKVIWYGFRPIVGVIRIEEFVEKCFPARPDTLAANSERDLAAIRAYLDAIVQKRHEEAQWLQKRLSKEDRRRIDALKMSLVKPTTSDE